MPTSEMIRLKNVRLSFPSLFKAKLPANETDPSKAKYKATFLLDPKTQADQIALIKAASKKIESEQWPKGPGKMKGRCWEQNSTTEQYEALKKAAEANNTTPPDAPYAGWEGMFSVVSSESSAPKVVNAKGVPTSEGQPGAPYGGCYVDAWISLWTQDNQHGKRVNANLLAVQFRADGEAFSARQSMVDGINFEDLSGQETDPLAGEDGEEEIPF